MGDSRNSSAHNGDMNPGRHQDEGFFGDGENDAFFSSLYDTIEGSSSSSPHLRPNLRFEFYGGEEWVETHLVVMAHWCENLPHVLPKREDGGLNCRVPASLGVTPESFRIFRKAIYLKRLPSRSLSLQERLEVRRLADHFGCRMIVQKCDDVQISLKNCHNLWDKWPEGSQVKEKALEMIKGNLKLFVDNSKCLEWGESLWVTILSCKDKDLPPPLPTEDELFYAVLRWRDKNKAFVDAHKFRSLFKDLFHYPLMSVKLLCSAKFRESGILNFPELSTVCEEKLDKAGNEAINFSRPRRESPTTFAPIASGSQQLMLMSSENPTTTTTTASTSTAQGDDDVTWPVVISVSGNNGNSIKDDSLGTENENTTLTASTPITTSASPPQDEPTCRRVRSVRVSSKKQNNAAPTTAHPQSSMAVVEPEPLPLVKTEPKESIQKKSSKRIRMSGSQCQNLGRKKRKSTQDPTTNPPTTTTDTPPPSQTLKKKSLATTFQELEDILLAASPGEEVELTSGIFDGKLRIANLPEGVRIYGAGPTTIIRATGTLGCIWYFTDAGKNCIIENMRFEAPEGNRSTEHNGLVVEKSDGVKIRNLDFLGCDLDIMDCDSADIAKVRVESSKYGIVLRTTTKNSVVKNCSFKNVTKGLTVHGNNNRISEIECEEVRRGVLFLRDGKKGKKGKKGMKNSCNGNILTDLTYFFNNEECNNAEDGQIAVEIQESTNNELRNIQCQGFDDIPSSAQTFGYALFIGQKPKRSIFIPSKNVINGVSGGQVWVAGKENVVQDVTLCKYLRAIGLRHHFTNCTVAVGKAYVELAKGIVCTNCNFGPSTPPTQTLRCGGDEGRRVLQANYLLCER